ncbi:MAG: ankyrin repeat domain-containing protein [Alphaproteobacteria bacterium]
MAQNRLSSYTVDKRDANGKTKLMEAASRGMHEATLEILAEGADINAADNAGYTVLIHTLMEKHEDMAALLMNKGAKPDTPTKTGVTPLMLCAMDKLHEGLEQCINRNVPLDAQENKKGMTALMLAIDRGDSYAAFRLLRAGADAENIRDNEGMSALSYACAKMNAADQQLFKSDLNDRRTKQEAARAKEIAENAKDATVLSHDIVPMKKVTLKIKPTDAIKL